MESMTTVMTIKYIYIYIDRLECACRVTNEGPWILDYRLVIVVMVATGQI